MAGPARRLRPPPGSTRDHVAHLVMMASPTHSRRVWLLQIDGVVVVLPCLRPQLRLLLYSDALTASSSSGRLFEVHDQDFEDQPAHWTHPFYIVPNSKCQNLVRIFQLTHLSIHI